MNRPRHPLCKSAPYNNIVNHNYSKILKSDWLSTVLIYNAMQSSDFVNHSHEYRPNWTPLSPIIISNNRLITEYLVQHSRYKCLIGFCLMCFLKDFPCHVVQKGEAKMDCDKDCDAFKASQEKLASKEDEIRKEKQRKAQQVLNSSLLWLILLPILYFYLCACQKKKNCSKMVSFQS